MREVLFKKSRAFVAMLLAAVLCIGANGIKVHAYTCSKCWSIMAEVCVKNKEKYEEGYHSYGFLFTKKCYLTARVSYGTFLCQKGHMEPWLDSDGNPAKHLCFEEHSACSKGQYNVCPF